MSTKTRSKKSRNAERKPEKKVRQHQSTLRLFSQVELPSENVRDLLRASEYGDIPTVQDIITNHPLLDTNASDSFGRTPLQIAVTNEHAEIVELLLDISSPANIYLALLLAINHNYENITELILQHPTYRQYHDCWQELANQLPDTSPFSDDISPIILACQKNLFGIVHLLLQDGMRVPVPHHFDCGCERCLEHRRDDQLKHAKRRLNEYRALTSEAYISLTSPDPFQTAFELCHEMDLRATWEKHFKREYKTLVSMLRRYAVKLLDCIRTHDELTTILNWPGASSHSNTDGDTTISKKSLPPAEAISPQPLARLRVAIRYHQKEFVAHWACQQELMRRWLRGFSQYHGSTGPTKIFANLFITLLCYPILIAFHWLAPESKLGRIVAKPLVKFVAYSMSYIFFLCILFIITITPNGFYKVPDRLSHVYHPPDAYQPLYDTISAMKGYQRSADLEVNDGLPLKSKQSLRYLLQEFCNYTIKSIPTEASKEPYVQSIGRLSLNGVRKVCTLDKDFIIRPHADNLVCWIVTVWLFGLLCRKVRQFIRGTMAGTGNIIPSILRSSPFDIIDVAQLALFVAALTCRVYAYIKVTEAVAFLLLQRPSLTTAGFFPGHLYWLNSDRVFFHRTDPLTMSELLFAVGGVFSFARLLYIFPALEVFGPCYSALMRVVKDVFAFFFVFTVVFAAFMIGAMNVYWYVNPEVRLSLQLDDNYKPNIPAEERFGNLELTFRTVFWSLFGLGESDYLSLGNYADSMIWVERVGYLLYGTYNIVVVLILLNMLIAMMAKSYDDVKQNAEMEWKFARAVLFLEFIPDVMPTIPTPFNLLPNPRYLWEMIGNLIDAVRPPPRLPKPRSLMFRMEEGAPHSPVASDSTDASTTTEQPRSSVVAPVQIRIENGDGDTSIIEEADDEDEAFSSTLPTDSSKLPESSKNLLKQNTFSSSTLSMDSTSQKASITKEQSSMRQKLEDRTEQATMTTPVDDGDDSEIMTTCCNFCLLMKCAKVEEEPPSPGLDRLQAPQSAHKYGANLHLSMPGTMHRNVPGLSVRKVNPALLKFRAVVFNILRRYILGLSTQSDAVVDLEEIKQDISSFRFEVLNLLGGNVSDDVGSSLLRQTAPVLGPTLNQPQTGGSIIRRASRTSLQQNISPQSVKSLSTRDTSAPAEVSLHRPSFSNNFLGVDQPMVSTLAPAELDDESSPPHPRAESSPLSSAMKSPRGRSFAPYRRRSLLPSSIVGTLMVSAETRKLAQATSANASDHASSSSSNEDDNDKNNESPPRLASQLKPTSSLSQRSWRGRQSVKTLIEESNEENDDEQL